MSSSMIVNGFASSVQSLFDKFCVEQDSPELWTTLETQIKDQAQKREKVCGSNELALKELNLNKDYYLNNMKEILHYKRDLNRSQVIDTTKLC